MDGDGVDAKHIWTCSVILGARGSNPGPALACFGGQSTVQKLWNWRLEIAIGIEILLGFPNCTRVEIH